MKTLRYVLVATGLVAIVVLSMSLDGSEPPAQEAVAPAPAALPPARQAPAVPPARAPVPQPPALLAAPEEIPGEEGTHGEFTTTTDLVKERIFKTEPRLAQFDYFRAHVLLDSNGRRDYEALLADTQMYEETRRALSYPADSQETMESSFKRLMRNDYLREALAWPQNPSRARLVSTVESILLEDSFSPGMAMGVKRAMASARLELYEIYADQEPERARALVEAARGTRLEKLMEYFAERNQRRLAKERELSLQAQAQARRPDAP